MTTTLITGANKSLGFETARQLVAAGHTVYVGARDETRGRAAAEAIGARLLVLDVTSDESVAAAAAQLTELDVLVNNAGIRGPLKAPGELTAADLRNVFETNVFGALRTLHAFLPLLEKSAAPVVVNVSSGLGSHTLATDPDSIASKFTPIAYGSSKAALNMVTVQFAKAYPGMRINAVDPGYTATDFNDNTGTQTVEEGAEIIVRMARIAADGPTGSFTDRHGTVPW
ncbi:SDR family NAD(P)-dependent oxidoreductase [Symbioplanes lichenis]|uniref:SDR family NAD(P)-dependent oxidoreductase n=1 Tax=Symbioplanes lichenis TaxID=1629072 RepID=UPI002738D8A7|nr:SDR family NAD(P)-dependent oxidoreductase [Actinoplanes lichenis]